MTQGAIQPGVPLVSFELFCLNYLEMPRSVTLTQPSESSTRFSGLISLCMILFLCMYSKPMSMLLMKNLVYLSLKVRLLPKWQRRSPPSRQSMMRQRCSLSWNEQRMLTRKGWYNFERNSFSFITDVTDFLLMIFTFDIYFIAYTALLFFTQTFHTFPKPPLPIGYRMVSCLLLISIGFVEDFEGELTLLRLRFRLTQFIWKKVSRYFYRSRRPGLEHSEGQASFGRESSFMETLQLNQANQYMETRGFWKITDCLSSWRLKPKLPPLRCIWMREGLCLVSQISLQCLRGERLESMGDLSRQLSQKDFLCSGLSC